MPSKWNGKLVNMVDCAEEQAEELEVLRSIFEGDEFFKELSETRFQYKYGAEDNRSILVEISWTESYPTTVPNISLELFHNSYLPSDFKAEIRDKLLEQAADLLESAMTYSLFDWMKENADDYINRIPELVIVKKSVSDSATDSTTEQPVKAKKEKKEQLTKAQKRRITEQTNYKGERERGWDWVDIVRHLSQTGVGQGS